MTPTPMTKEQAEIELAMAQRQKALAEIDVLRRTTPFTETIKLVGSMVLGIGGAVAAIAGFQLAEVKAEKFKAEAAAAVKARDATQAEVATLTLSRDELNMQLGQLQQKVQSTTLELASTSDALAAAQRDATNPAFSATLKTLQQSVNASDIALRAAAPGSPQKAAGTPLATLVERLYAPKASDRGGAYEELMSSHAHDPALVPALLDYAEQHLNNANGLYNSVVVLLALDPKLLKPHWTTVRALAEKSKANGPRTAELANRLLQIPSP